MLFSYTAAKQPPVFFLSHSFLNLLFFFPVANTSSPIQFLNLEYLMEPFCLQQIFKPILHLYAGNTFFVNHPFKSQFFQLINKSTKLELMCQKYSASFENDKSLLVMSILQSLLPFTLLAVCMQTLHNGAKIFMMSNLDLDQSTISKETFPKLLLSMNFQKCRRCI